MNSIDTLLIGGDHSRDSRGIPIAITGERELIQRALLRLTIKKGSFELDPTLGSELYKLRGIRGKDLERLAQSYVQEALLPMPELAVSSVSVRHGNNGVLNLFVGLTTQENHYQLEVAIN